MVAYVGGPRNDAAGVSRRDIVFARTGRCRRRWCRCGRLASGSIEEVKLQAVHQPARVAFKLCRMRPGVALRAHSSTVAGVAIQGAVDDLKIGRILVQTHLKVEEWWPGYTEQVFPEFDVEDAIGRSSRYSGKYPLPVRGILIVQVPPVWSDQVDHACGGQWAFVKEIRVASTRKLQVAV